MDSARTPPLGLFLGRRYAAGGPPTTWLLCQPGGGLLAYVGARMGVHPTTLTLIGLAIGVVGCAVLAVADQATVFALAGAVLVLSYLFDCADGQLARATGRTSERGAWLDVLCDGAIVVSLALAVEHQGGGNRPLLTLGAAALLGVGRMASLVTGTLARRNAARDEWTTTGLMHVARRFYVSLVDTPVVYVALTVTGATGGPLALTAAVLGVAAVAHAMTVGLRSYGDYPADHRPVA